MRRWLSVLLAALLTLSITACSPPEIDSDQFNVFVDTLIEIGIQAAALDGDGSEADDTTPGKNASGETVKAELRGGIGASEKGEKNTLPEDGSYTTKEDVALYLHLYGHLPNNFITKAEARELGWEKDSLEPFAPGKCIGGDYFGNYEELLPEGRDYTECDIDTLGADSRGVKRIVFSDDGLIYYTDDHYQSFELLYGEE